jgi:CheY-like chemotaxis protein
VEAGAAGPGLGPGAWVVLTVSDTGSGIDPEDLPNIFEPFFTTKEKGQGTGLGLASVYAIVNQSGGEILVRSEAGRGTSFSVYLPWAEGVLDPRPLAAPLAAPPVVRGTGTILLVEDEEVLRSLAREILEEAGYRVLAAGRAEAAIELARAHPGPIDLLLADVAMPGMKGPELAVALGEVRPGLKVLLMSGHTDDAVVRRGVQGQRPVPPLLQKPFSVRELVDRVRAAIAAGGRPSDV